MLQVQLPTALAEAKALAKRKSGVAAA
jgi:hypothetical protein